MSVLLKLYSTTHCRLCEQAEALVKKMCLKNNVKFNVIEITDDAILLDLYELKIPVLKRLDANSEISWPFSAIDIEQLIS